MINTFETALSSYLRSTRHSTKIQRQRTPRADNQTGSKFSGQKVAQRTKSGRVHLAVNTYRKRELHRDTQELGLAKLVIEAPAVALITKLELRLHELNQADISIQVQPADIKLRMPENFGPLEEFTLCLTTRDNTEQGYLHFVARRSSDFAMVYCDPVKVESVTGVRSAA